MSKLKVLEVKFDNNGFKGTIYPVILYDESEMILVDCGYPGFLPLIEKCARDEGIDIGKITKLIITHHDHDHMGAAKDFKRKYPKLNIIASGLDEKYISGKEKSLRLVQAEAIYEGLPKEEKEGARYFQKMLEAVENVEVDLLVNEGDVFNWCGGIEIVGTPGHMPGHISIYVKESKTLIAGDALVVEGNELKIANPRFTLNMEQAKESIHKLLNYDIEVIVSYHGGIFTGDIKGELRNI